MVHILLDPRRILSAIEDRYQWPHGARPANFASLLRETAGLPGSLEGDCLEQELAFLDNPAAAIPVSLPNSALFLAQAWQNLIADNELPVVAEQMPADGGRLPPLIDPRNTTGDQPPSVTARVCTAWHNTGGIWRRNQPLSGPPDGWAARLLTTKSEHRAPPADFANQLPRCPVREETLAGQVHTPMFARIAAKAAAVATAAITAVPEILATLIPALSTARTGYLATKATGGSGWKTLIVAKVDWRCWARRFPGWDVRDRVGHPAYPREGQRGKEGAWEGWCRGGLEEHLACPRPPRAAGGWPSRGIGRRHAGNPGGGPSGSV